MRRPLCSMKKVLLSLRALLLVLMLGCVGSAFAYDFCVDDIYYTVDSATAEATVVYKERYKPYYSGNMVIPETVTYEGTTYTVTAIGEMTFAYCNMESVTLPNTLKTINDHAFAFCNGLSEIIIPNSVTTIGRYVFWNCTALRRVFIGSGVQSIDQYLIESCYDVESLEVHPDNPYFDSREGCNAIIETATNSLIVGCKNTVFPSTITEIGHEAFYEGTGPEHVVIPNSVTKVGVIAFYRTKGVKSIVVGSGVVDMPDNPFCYIPDLESLSVHPDNPVFDSRNDCNAVIITATNTLFAACRNTVIPEGITTIGTWAYLGCTGLDRIEIPSTVTHIDQVAFGECDVRHMTIPGNVKTIDGFAFDMCYNLRDVYIEDGVEQLGHEMFRLCVSLKRLRLPNTITAIPYGMLWQCDSLPELIIPNSVTKVGDNAALYCPALKRIVIGSGVTSLGHYAFMSASQATTVTCLAPTPPSTGISTLHWGWKDKTTLRVPWSSLEVYQTYWGEYFLEIVGCSDDGSAGPGDSSGDGIIGISDVTVLIDAIMSGDTSGVNVENADLNGNGRLDIGDVATIIDMILNP